jgi:ABC-type sugar transport system ATPase subunit
MTRILAFLNQTSAIPSGNETVQTFETLQFKNVSFTYPETQIEALSNLTLEINKGKTVAFIGHTGSGKSSLVQLLMKAYMPTFGTISMNGIDIAQLETNAYRSLMGIVPQDVFLFSDTIENNIRFEEQVVELDLELQNVIHERDLDMTQINKNTKDTFDNIEMIWAEHEEFRFKMDYTLSNLETQIQYVHSDTQCNTENITNYAVELEKLKIKVDSLNRLFTDHELELNEHKWNVKQIKEKQQIIYNMLSIGRKYDSVIKDLVIFKKRITFFLMMTYFFFIPIYILLHF